MLRLRLGSLGLVLLLAFGCPSDPPPDEGWRPAYDATDGGWLLSLWGPSADELYAVGGDNQPSRGHVMRRRGDTWGEVDLGLEGVPLLNWVTGFGPDDVIFVGDAGTIIRGDGETWTRQESPTDQDLWGVWGSGPDDVWAVGGIPFLGGRPTIVHWDGEAWSNVEPPTLERANVFAFFKVWGSGPNDVWIVGQRGAVVRWNGEVFEEQLVGVDADLISVWGTGPDHVAMVGGRGTGWIATWNGAEFRRRQPTAIPGLNGVWLRGDAIHVVGEQGELARFDFETLELQDEFFPETNLAFHAVFGDGEKLTSVGGNFSAPNGPYLGIAYERELTAED
ncbi:MAG: hypothetical protein H6722_34640 [Sandaracinus sp.]|nr:hypothetical protein [Sandaracinus sp.]